MPGAAAVPKPGLKTGHAVVIACFILLVTVIAVVIVIAGTGGGGIDRARFGGDDHMGGGAGTSSILDRNPLVGAWEHETDWDIGIEFNRNGTGAFFEMGIWYDIEWSVETRGGREILAVDLLDSFTGRWVEAIRLEFSLLRNNEVLELRDMDGWGFDRFIRIN
jgi:hypothetical protein